MDVIIFLAIASVAFNSLMGVFYLTKILETIELSQKILTAIRCEQACKKGGTESGNLEENTDGRETETVAQKNG